MLKGSEGSKPVQLLGFDQSLTAWVADFAPGRQPINIVEKADRASAEGRRRKRRMSQINWLVGMLGAEILPDLCSQRQTQKAFPMDSLNDFNASCVGRR